ncbi:hypothetical protein Taro_016278 [Colocasia esculenta]|uniref:Uncharacterized protein n=1 Tax=Colocasia esculenta TaxID=4460 RepID=A0A843UK59_COLES|nr:hypothetical protein [Colocasia esculenta]
MESGIRTRFEDELCKGSRELKVSASEISNECNVPADADEVKVEVHGDGSNAGNLSIKGSLCCEDRPELLTDLR